MVSKTTGNQFDILVEFMEENEGIAKGYLNAPQYKATAQKKWVEITSRLNEVGPPFKTVVGWKKVWKDFRYHIKNKMRHNTKCHNGTGGGPNNKKFITPIEDRVAALCDLNASVEGTSGVKAFGAECNENLDPNFNASVEKDLEDLLNEEELELVPPTRPNLASSSEKPQKEQREPSRCTKTKLTSKQLIEKQIGTQENFHRNTIRALKDFSRATKMASAKNDQNKGEIVAAINGLKDTVKEWATHEKEYKFEKLKIRKTELELKLRKVEIAERKLAVRKQYTK